MVAKSRSNTRRQLLTALGVLVTHAGLGSPTDAIRSAARNKEVEYGQDSLGLRIRSRYVDNSNGLEDASCSRPASGASHLARSCNE